MWVFALFPNFTHHWAFLSNGSGISELSVPRHSACVACFRGQQCSGIVWFAAVNTFQSVKLPYICPAESTRRTELRVTYIFPAYGAHLCASLLIPVQNPSKTVIVNLIRLKNVTSCLNW